MFQEEFGERLLAQPGEPRYCRLAANVQLFAKVTRVCKVDRNSFRPPPKVDSVIVKVSPRKEILPVRPQSVQTSLHSRRAGADICGGIACAYER